MGIADGIFLAGIDLFFATKSDTLGVTVELREVTNGVITSRSPAFGRVRLAPADVNVTSVETVADGTSTLESTYFRFPSPVYLKGNAEYAFVVKPQGSNPDYRLWVSELGQVDVQNPSLGRVTSQPAEGLLFTSANDRTYVPRQNEDIKFNLYRANFSTANTVSVTLENTDDDYLTVGRYPGASPLSVGDRIEVTSARTNWGILKYHDRSTGATTINVMNGAFNVGNIIADEAGTEATITERGNIAYETLAPKVSSLTFPRTSLTWSIRGEQTDGTIDAAPGVSVINQVDNTFADTSRVIDSYSANTTHKSFRLIGTMSSTGDGRLSPVIDLGRSVSVIGVHNVINDSADTETGNFGGADARYITKRVALADGQDAEDLLVYLTAYRPPGTAVRVFGRFQGGEDDTPFNEHDYTELVATDPNLFSSLSDTNNFVELSFNVPRSAQTDAGDDNAAYLQDDGAIRFTDATTPPTVYRMFKYFAVKVVFTSSVGAHVVPRVKDLRVIALQA